MECINLLKDVYWYNLISCSRVFEWHKRFSEDWKWKMINIQVTLRLRKLTKTFRKSVKLFAKINVWVWEWSQTWWVLTERQCDKSCGRSGRISGRTTSECCIRTMPQLTTPFKWRSFFSINAFQYLNILHVRGFGILLLFPVLQSEKYTEGDQFSISWWGEGKNGTATERPGGWWAVALLWTMEDTNAAVCR